MNREVAVIDAPSRNGLKQPYKDLLPPLSNDEKSALEASIELEGVRDAIVIDEDGNILDGHHRYAIDHNVPLRVVRGLSDAEKKAFVFRANFARRNLSPDQKAEKLKVMRGIAVELNAAGWAQAAIGAALGVSRTTVEGWLTTNDESVNGYKPAHHDGRVTIPKDEHTVIYDRYQSGETQEQIAADYGVTQPAIHKIVVMEAARRTTPQSATTPPIPTGKYSCIVIDPPWPVAKIERKERPNQGVALDYPTMTVDEIEALPIGDLACDDCHLYLWVTQKYLPAGLDLVEGWGFQYQCLLTWVKPTGMTPYSWMYNTEHVIYAHRGKLRLQRFGLKLSFDAPVVGHSVKPDAFYERVLQASPEPRLEMFARRDRDGFAVWGNEV